MSRSPFPKSCQSKLDQKANRRICRASQKTKKQALSAFEIPSKYKPQSELHLPRRCSLRKRSYSSRVGCDLCGVGIDNQRRLSRRVVVLNVEYVERFKTELQVHTLLHGKTFEQGEVGVETRRSTKHIAAEVSKSPRRNSKGARIKPARSGMHCIGGPSTI